MKLTTLDLFSGIGGFARGLEATDFFETSCFVENDPYCQAVLRHHWPEVPILGDIRDVKGPDLPTRPDVICGGFPCQPFSHAGNQQGQDDPRHLWPEMLRLIRECRPTWVIGENVTGLIRLGLDEVLSDLAAEGYAARTFNIPACAVGAPHIRQRLWVVAHSDSQGEPDKPFDGGPGSGQLGFGFVADTTDNRIGWRQQQSKGGKSTGDVADTDNERRHGSAGEHGSHGWQVTTGDGETMADTKRPGTGVEESRDSGQGRESADTRQSKVLRQEDGACSSEGFAASGGRSEVWWEVEPPVGRVVDGLPNRVSQLRALGNSIIPQIAQKIGEAIKETYNG